MAFTIDLSSLIKPVILARYRRDRKTGNFKITEIKKYSTFTKCSLELKKKECSHNLIFKIISKRLCPFTRIHCPTWVINDELFNYAVFLARFHLESRCLWVFIILVGFSAIFLLFGKVSFF